jgi:hypothetical protein
MKIINSRTQAKSSVNAKVGDVVATDNGGYYLVYYNYLPKRVPLEWTPVKLLHFETLKPTTGEIDLELIEEGFKFFDEFGEEITVVEVFDREKIELVISD